MADRGPPVIVQADIDWLVQVEKPVHDAGWRSRLLPPGRGLADERGRVDLGELPEGEPLGGWLHLYSRRNLRHTGGDWSVGLVYTDYADNSYQVIRCNGPHLTVHENRIEGNRIVGRPHVHRLTERYLRHRGAKPDGYAEPSQAFSAIDEAVEHLATLVNLQPVERMFL
jgi:hypothetical protein